MPPGKVGDAVYKLRSRGLLGRDVRGAWAAVARREVAGAKDRVPPQGALLRRQHAAERALLIRDITFNVYSEKEGAERIFPFDIIPRIVEAAEWACIERGLRQRIQALNLFLDDIYHGQKILKDGVIPATLVSSAQGFRQPLQQTCLPGTTHHTFATTV